MQDDASAFAGVAFHCYNGSVSEQDVFHLAFPSTVSCFTLTRLQTLCFPMKPVGYILHGMLRGLWQRLVG